MSEEQNILPEGWKMVKLGDVVTYSKGKKPKILCDDIKKGCDIPYINIKAFEKGVYTQFTNGDKCNLCNDGDLLMVWDGARSGLTGKAKKGAVGSTLMKIDPIKVIHKEYLYNFLLSVYKLINTNPRGVGIPHVEPKLLWNLELVLPPLPTQQAIVAKIEELFSELDNGIANLTAAQQQLDTYRQSVLKWAFEGKLTNDDVQDEELPDGWEWVKLEEIAEHITDGDHQAPPKKKEGIPFITISNIDKRNNKIDFSNTFFVSREYYDNLKDSRRVKRGDVLYTVTGSFGIPVKIDFDKDFCFQRHIGLIRPLKTISQIWLYYLLQTTHVYNQAKKSATGTAQKTVGLKSLREFLIPLCSLKEQEQVVQEIESRLSVADKLQETITESLNKATSLRQSILKQAFEGKLVG